MKQRLVKIGVFVGRWFAAFSLATWGVLKIEQQVNHPIEGWRNIAVWCILYFSFYTVILQPEGVLLVLKHAVLLWLDWDIEGIAYTFGSLHDGPNHD